MYGASHILVKHAGSRRTASWKDPEGKAIKARTKEQAEDILKGFLATIGGDAAKFAQIASKESDCGSAQNEGSLGEFGSGDMMKAFEDAVAALEVGAITPGTIHTDSGEHIIMRTK